MQPVEIVPSDASWTAEFRALAGSLRTCLGELALRIDHIGSTSVPGLAAKDVIDVQVTVVALDVDRLVPAFAAGEFEPHPTIRTDHRPPGVDRLDEDWAKMLFAPRLGRRPAHIHVRVADRPNQRYALLFRDYLRAHPRAAAAYAELKRRLAALGLSRGVYADVKDPACDIIMAAAHDWAVGVAWHPGPSDA